MYRRLDRQTDRQTDKQTQPINDIDSFHASHPRDHTSEACTYESCAFLRPHHKDTHWQCGHILVQLATKMLWKKTCVVCIASGRNKTWCLCTRNNQDPYGGRISFSVVSESEFKSKDPGFDPLVRQGEGQFFCPSESTLVQTCWCLTNLCVYGMHPNQCAR